MVTPRSRGRFGTDPGLRGYSSCSSSHGRAAELLIAFETNPLHWPGMNVAFLFSFFLSTFGALLVIPYAKRRPKGAPVSWGEAMLASVYVFGLMFIAFGVVPHQFIDHADKELGWSKNNIIFGPGDIFKPQAYGGWFPFTMSYEAVRDIVVIVIHLWYFGLRHLQARSAGPLCCRAAPDPRCQITPPNSLRWICARTSTALSMPPAFLPIAQGVW